MERDLIRASQIKIVNVKIRIILMMPKMMALDGRGWGVNKLTEMVGGVTFMANEFIKVK